MFAVLKIDIYLFLIVLFPTKCMTLIFPFLDGDVPRRPSYDVYISQLMRFTNVLAMIQMSCDSLHA